MQDTIDNRLFLLMQKVLYSDSRYWVSTEVKVSNEAGFVTLLGHSNPSRHIIKSTRNTDGVTSYKVHGETLLYTTYNGLIFWISPKHVLKRYDNIIRGLCPELTLENRIDFLNNYHLED